LNGGWDFALIFDSSPIQPMARSDAPAPAGGVPVAPDPTAGYSIFEAMEKQLGLRLETMKGLRPVIVIDHIEEKPTDN
jgi:uncharacterized protein (TIGR03435 family)